MDKNKLKNSNKYFLFLILITVALSVILLRDYLVLVIVSFVVANLFQPLHDKVKSLLKERTAIATPLSLLIIFSLVIIPVVAALFIVINQLISMTTQLRQVVANEEINLDQIIEVVNTFTTRFNVTVTQEEVFNSLRQVLDQLSGSIVSSLSNVGSSFFSSFTRFIIFLILLGSLLNRLPDLKEKYKQISPLPKEIDDMYIQRIFAMSNSMFKSTFIVAVIQGIVSAIILKIAGVDYALFWGILSIITAILPLGSGFFTIPIGLILMLSGQVLPGIFVILASIMIVGLIDNFLRPKLASSKGQLDEVLVLLGIVGGISMFGFWGIVIGPVIMIILKTSFEVYKKYYQEINDVE
jgi:predicted PurR-regulated permease PerM